MRTIVLLILLCLATSSADAQSQKARNLYNQAQQYIQERSYTEALRSLDECINADRTWAEPRVALAELRYGLQMYPEAIQQMQYVLNKPLRIAPDKQGEYWSLLGKYLYQNEITKSDPSQRKFDEATAAFQNALGLDKKVHEASYYMSRISVARNEYTKAEEYIKAALAGQPTNMAYRTLRAEILYQKGEIDDADTEAIDIVDKLSSVPDSKEYIEAKELLLHVQTDIGRRFWKRVAYFAGPTVVLLIGIYFMVNTIRGRQEDREVKIEQTDLPLDGATYEEISRWALMRLGAMTQMSHGMLYLMNLDGTEMVAKATLALEPYEVHPLRIEEAELPRWTEHNDGKPFLFKAEKKEIAFTKAFPDAREGLEPLQIRIGVPLMFQEKLLGIAFLGVEESKDILRLKKLYDKSQSDIYRIAIEVSSALYRVKEGELSDVDVLTKFKSRSYVEDNLPRALINAQEAGRKGMVAIVEYDQFKPLQEQLGEPQADAMLKLIATEIKNHVTSTDGMIARFEDGKICVYTSVKDLKEAKEIGEGLRKSVADAPIPSNYPPPTASVGMAVYPDHGNKADLLLWAADRVMMGISANGGDGLGMADGSAQKEGPAKPPWLVSSTPNTPPSTPPLPAVLNVPPVPSRPFMPAKTAPPADPSASADMPTPSKAASPPAGAAAPVPVIEGPGAPPPTAAPSPQTPAKGLPGREKSPGSGFFGGAGPRTPAPNFLAPAPRAEPAEDSPDVGSTASTAPAAPMTPFTPGKPRAPDAVVTAQTATASAAPSPPPLPSAPSTSLSSPALRGFSGGSLLRLPKPPAASDTSSIRPNVPSPRPPPVAGFGGVGPIRTPEVALRVPASPDTGSPSDTVVFEAALATSLDSEVAPPATPTSRPPTAGFGRGFGANPANVTTPPRGDNAPDSSTRPSAAPTARSDSEGVSTRARRNDTDSDAGVSAYVGDLKPDATVPREATNDIVPDTKQQDDGASDDGTAVRTPPPISRPFVPFASRPTVPGLSEVHIPSFPPVAPAVNSTAPSTTSTSSYARAVASSSIDEMFADLRRKPDAKSAGDGGTAPNGNAAGTPTILRPKPGFLGIHLPPGGPGADGGVPTLSAKNFLPAEMASKPPMPHTSRSVEGKAGIPGATTASLLKSASLMPKLIDSKPQLVTAVRDREAALSTSAPTSKPVIPPTARGSEEIGALFAALSVGEPSKPPTPRPADRAASSQAAVFPPSAVDANRGARSSPDDAGSSKRPTVSAIPGFQAPSSVPASPTVNRSGSRPTGGRDVEEALGREIQRASTKNEPCSVVYYELDRRSAIEQSVGAEKLKEIERDIASLVNDLLKEGTDFAGAWHDGLAIILPRTSPRIACNLAEQIRLTVGNLNFSGVSDHTTLSLGIAAFPEHATSTDLLLNAAVQAACDIQGGGGNNYKVFGR